MAHIVLGVDFSEGSKLALQAAAKMARDTDASVVMVHAYSKLPQAVANVELMRTERPSLQAEQDMDEAMELSQKWAKMLRKEGVDVEVVADHMDPAELLLETAERHDAALIVIGTQGLGAVKRFILGSVAERVINKSDRPVLVVPRRMRSG